MKITRILLFAALILAIGHPLFGEESKPTLGLSIPFELLASMQGTINLDCDSDGDGTTREMIRSLQKKGRRAHYEHEEHGERLEADRRGDRFRMTSWEDGARQLDLEMPWPVAECIFGGRKGDSMEIEIDRIEELGGFELSVVGETAGLRVSVD